MKNFIKTFLVLSSLIFASTSYAIDPPKVVYRVSSRAPEDVFASGFPAEGNDRDLLRYVSGASTHTGTSAYISTTQWLMQAYRFSALFLQVYPGVPVYIYSVRPTENFYSVAASLRYAREVLPNPEVRQQASAIALATQGQEDGHWAARGGIAPEQILGGRRFYWNHGYLGLGETIQNDRYFFLPPVISNFPMPIQNATVADAYAAEESHGVGFMTYPYADMGCDQRPRQRKAVGASHCLKVQRFSFRELRFRTVAKMIATGILSGATTGQLLSVPGHDEL